MSCTTNPRPANAPTGRTPPPESRPLLEDGAAAQGFGLAEAGRAVLRAVLRAHPEGVDVALEPGVVRGVDPQLVGPRTEDNGLALAGERAQDQVALVGV